MQSFVTVVTPATSYDLTDLTTVKAELGITNTSEDANIAKWITQASGEIASYCNRTLVKETVKQVYRVLFVRGLQREHEEQIVLSRAPVSSITSAVLDGTALVEGTDYERDADGHLYRLDTYGNAVRWFFGRLEVTYQAGYDLTDARISPVIRACISLVKLIRSASTRDPLVKQESVQGVGEVQYWVGGVPGTVGNLPPDIQAMLDPFRDVAV